MTNETPKRLMPPRLNLGRSYATTMMGPISRYKEYLAGRSFSKNLFGYREVMGFFLPPWQRGSVWTEKQKIAFVESAWKGVNLGTYSYNTAEIGSPYDNLLIDGQQRMTALQDYVEDKFPVFGYRYSEVTIVDRRMFEMMTTFASYETETEDETYLREYYNMLNFGGTAHKEDERA
ncbi:hypothetical protein PHIM7_58 [Sinorhizobium phage phiM7]|uniref:GmrSD restriction endonucleases N-terminal domain-containing protein n=3 Tax=Emdodecavirus TaxID=1980937 RepID=S5MPF9_9CAUD|nr:hypothetical protein AB690_gp065 [Sinorhizobium phage phiM12]YP_009212314.1 HNH endonuclease [Sinorhizobium phage phiN3]YP_009601183.1 hypothetical protein FDH46_gp058 [Sinorhizobium phage phiM7]AKF12966.1 hypothetical protein PHIM19_59 [Sinorhizobium phage phiM19]AGR47710.2 hypothetical protein SmphiM12_078 [Sinorhizobium phage phiM12]AKF12606.1 hypothetical protein PHIM7_58 [Sinorhizobium phage phiM7]AKF13339.1 HNH endonuclease [Sinorhizobium phage phiN3]